MLESRKEAPIPPDPAITTNSGKNNTPNMTEPDPFGTKEVMEIDDKDLPFEFLD